MTRNTKHPLPGVSIPLALTTLAGAGVWATWLAPTYIREYVATTRGVTPTFSPSHDQILLGVVIPAMLLALAALALTRWRHR